MAILWKAYFEPLLTSLGNNMWFSICVHVEKYSHLIQVFSSVYQMFVLKHVLFAVLNIIFLGCTLPYGYMLKTANYDTKQNISLKFNLWVSALGAKIWWIIFLKILHLFLTNIYIQHVNYLTLCLSNAQLSGPQAFQRWGREGRQHNCEKLIVLYFIARKEHIEESGWIVTKVLINTLLKNQLLNGKLWIECETNWWVFQFP